MAACPPGLAACGLLGPAHAHGHMQLERLKHWFNLGSTSPSPWLSASIARLSACQWCLSVGMDGRVCALCCKKRFFKARQRLSAAERVCVTLAFLEEKNQNELRGGYTLARDPARCSRWITPAFFFIFFLNKSETVGIHVLHVEHGQASATRNGWECAQTQKTSLLRRL